VIPALTSDPLNLDSPPSSRNAPCLSFPPPGEKHFGGRLRGNDGSGWMFDGACSHDLRRRTADENWG
jgi:hypothetical protein